MVDNTASWRQLDEYDLSLSTADVSDVGGCWTLGCTSSPVAGGGGGGGSVFLKELTLNVPGVIIGVFSELEQCPVKVSSERCLNIRDHMPHAAAATTTTTTRTSAATSVRIKSLFSVHLDSNGKIAWSHFETLLQHVVCVVLKRGILG